MKKAEELMRKKREYEEALAKLKAKKESEEMKLQMVCHNALSHEDAFVVAEGITCILFPIQNNKWEKALRVLKSGDASIGDLYSLTAAAGSASIDPPSVDAVLQAILLTSVFSRLFAC